MPLPEVSKVAELILSRSGADSRASFTLEDSFNEFDACKKFKDRHPLVVKYAAAFEGQIKNYGVHAAGAVIGDGDLRKYASLRFDRTKISPTGRVSTLINVDKRDIDDLGLLKLDLLGLNMLTVMKECKRLVAERHDIHIDLDAADL